MQTYSSIFTTSDITEDLDRTNIKNITYNNKFYDGTIGGYTIMQYKVELVPGFKQNDERFKYPDSNDGGHWRYTDPLPEIEACKNSNDNTNGNFYNVCHMLRAWKNKKGFKFKGLLIDTLTNNFFQDNEDYKDASYSSYLELVKSIFEFLKDSTILYLLNQNN